VICDPIDVGVHAQRNGSDPARAAGDGIQHFEFGCRLDVETADACRQRGLHFGRSLADAGEDSPRGIAAGGNDSRELPAGDDVEPAPEARQNVQHGEVGIRLDRIAHEVGHALERGVEGPVSSFERRARVDVTGRAEAFGDVG